jgi:hypothetical protein
MLNNILITCFTESLNGCNLWLYGNANNCVILAFESSIKKQATWFKWRLKTAKFSPCFDRESCELNELSHTFKICVLIKK